MPKINKVGPALLWPWVANLCKKIFFCFSSFWKLFCLDLPGLLMRVLWWPQIAKTREFSNVSAFRSFVALIDLGCCSRHYDDHKPRKIAFFYFWILFCLNWTDLLMTLLPPSHTVKICEFLHFTSFV